MGRLISAIFHRNSCLFSCPPHPFSPLNLYVPLFSEVPLFFVGGLPVMSQPFALSDFHVRKNCREGGAFRAAGIDAESDPFRALPHMTYPHLGEPFTVLRTLYAIIILSAAESVPHGFHLRRYGGSGPIRIAVVSDHAAQMLELLVFVLHRAFEPVFTVQIHDDAALVETVIGFGEIGLDHERSAPCIP